jgi:acyl-CoA thioesterase FadM
MNLYFRLLLLFLRSVLAYRRQDLFAPCATRLRVNPFDLDMNLHMNNGRYFSIMDLGRIDLMLRAGVFWKFLRLGLYPVVTSESIRFKRSLQPFERFDTVTLIDSWDDNDFFLIQKFVCGEQVVAEGYVQGRFRRRSRKGSVPTAEIFTLLGMPSYPGAKLSELARAQLAIESQLAVKSLLTPGS